MADLDWGRIVNIGGGAILLQIQLRQLAEGLGISTGRAHELLVQVERERGTTQNVRKGAR